MPTERQIEQAVGELGELLSAREGEVDLSRFEDHETAVSFTREELGETDPGPWSHQRDVMELVAYSDRVAWRGAQGIGKDWTAARIALWWTFRGGLTIISGPTARQVHEILMRKEIARAFRRSGLAGELYTNSLRIRDQEAGILAFTSSEASGLTGFHDSKVLAILTEAQAVERAGWEGLMACTTGEDDKLLAIGNPLEPTGQFYEISRPGSGWETYQTAATEHPNFTGECYVPGGPSEEWLERMEDMWGRNTPMWTARVGGEFPRDSVGGLYSAESVDGAIERRQEGAWTQQWAEEEPVLAVDVARHGLDATVAALVQGRYVRWLESWRGASTTETADRVEELAYRAGMLPNVDERVKLERAQASIGTERPHGRILVDSVGVGAGVVDELKDRSWKADGFKASRRAKDRSRFRDMKAESAWRLRELLEDGDVALPDDRQLREELLSVKWSPDSKGRVAVESKDDLRSRLGRSPDRLDAVTMGVWGAGTAKDVGNTALLAGI